MCVLQDAPVTERFNEVITIRCMLPLPLTAAAPFLCAAHWCIEDDLAQHLQEPQAHRLLR